MANLTKIYIKRGARVAVKRFKMPPIKRDMKEKEYIETDSEGILLYKLLSDGFAKDVKDRSRNELISLWEKTYK